ncbi:MAG: T9SS type A sorting domain-containing protein, partial [Bacteroidota bacterium]
RLLYPPLDLQESTIAICPTEQYLSAPAPTARTSASSVIQITPNPATNFLNLRVPDTSPEQACQFKLYNPQGQLVRSTRIEAEEVKIKLRDLPAGIYHIQLRRTSGTTLHAQSILIQ